MKFAISYTKVKGYGKSDSKLAQELNKYTQEVN